MSGKSINKSFDVDDLLIWSHQTQHICDAHDVHSLKRSFLIKF